MTEHVRRYYHREEEFLNEFPFVVSAAVNLLNGGWEPDYFCDDASRQNLAYLLSTGGLVSLSFDGAAVYHDARGFSSAQIVLKSSTRIVTVRVRKDGNDLVAEKVVDKAAKPSHFGRAMGNRPGDRPAGV
jgi:hypothetical protein